MYGRAGPRAQGSEAILVCTDSSRGQTIRIKEQVRWKGEEVARDTGRETSLKPEHKSYLCSRGRDRCKTEISNCIQAAKLGSSQQYLQSESTV
jgi:hypothetical protein